MAKYKVILEIDEKFFRCLNCPLTHVVGGCKLQKLSPMLTPYSELLKNCPLELIESEASDGEKRTN